MNDNKIKKFLIDGFHTPEKDAEEADQPEETGEVEMDPEPEPTETEETSLEEETEEEEPVEAGPDPMESLRGELDEIKSMLQDIRENQPKVELPDMSAYLTDRERMKNLTHAIEKRDASTANKNLIRAMEQISVMREDFFKLCQGMRSRIDKMSAADVLSSFEAYEVDMENILIDGGVVIGPFPYEKLNTLHQRIVDVIPTDDPEKNSTIAERLSDGYKIGDKVLLKEKVKIYKFTEAEKAAKPSEADEETARETVSGDITETVSETTSEEKENTDTQEAKE